jgi:hypothetical protein
MGNIAQLIADTRMHVRCNNCSQSQQPVKVYTPKTMSIYKLFLSTQSSFTAVCVGCTKTEEKVWGCVYQWDIVPDRNSDSKESDAH